MKTTITVAIGVLVLLTVGTLLSAQEKDTKPTQIETEESSSNSAKVLGESTVEQDNEQDSIFEKISVLKAKDLIAQSGESLQIIDIRTSEEFLSGNIEKSTNIDFFINFEEEIGKLDNNGKYLIYCKSGNRTEQAKQIFEKLDFREIYELEGGYNAWIISEF